MNEEKKYEFLNEAFLETMNDIGRYGNEKYGKESFHQRALKGDKSRGDLFTCRTSSEAILDHAVGHVILYEDKAKHDHFGTLGHQLAAVAFNAMMEFYFAGLEEEKNED